MKIIVTGAGGMVGRAVVTHSRLQGDEIIDLAHQDLDITDESAVNKIIERERPAAVINCAAWTDVDGCESDPDRAVRANALGPELLALACRRIDAVLMTISTDYVFDGNKEGFYTQRDQPNPQSTYGASKLDGERRVHNAWARTVIVRSGYIFGPDGSNFLSTFLARGLRGEQLNVINDMFGTPTYAEDLAQRLLELARLDLPGIYHVVNRGPGVSFAEFAAAGFAEAELDPALLHPVTLDSLQRPAKRPRNSRMRCLISDSLGLQPLPEWREALRRFVAQETGKSLSNPTENSRGTSAKRFA